jgi:hypothetical protein
LSGAGLFEHAMVSLGRSTQSTEVSLAVIEIDPRRALAHVTSAGERFGLLVEGSGRVVSLGPPSPPLGRPGWAASEQDLPYSQGSRLVLFADCARAGPSGETACEVVSRNLGDRVEPGRVEEAVARSVAESASGSDGEDALIVILERLL